MQKLVYKLIQFILDVQQSIHQKKLQKLQNSFKTGSTKRVFLGENELVLNAQTELKKAELNKKVKEIVKQRIKSPEQLLDFIKEQGTDVFRLKNADVFLKLINEDEGFITPAKGIRALAINLFTSINTYKKPVI